MGPTDFGGGGLAHPRELANSSVLMQHPDPAICQNLGGWRGGLGGGIWGGGGRLEGVWGGGGAAVGGGGPKGGLRATHYYHMHTSRGDVCLGRVWGSCWWLL